jgi:hypothetical protein
MFDFVSARALSNWSLARKGVSFQANIFPATKVLMAAAFRARGFSSGRRGWTFLVWTPKKSALF